MAATTMPSMSSIISRLEADFPELKFEAGDSFAWTPDKKTVVYDDADPNAEALLLHELSHGVLGHTDYQTDVQLVSMEAAAWDKALEIGKHYSVAIDNAVIDEHLDTYRDWLHARSTCPKCTATGFQKGQNLYSCPACTSEWRVNEARVCALRRYAVH